MKKNYITTFGIAAVVLLWIGLTGFAWLKKPQEKSLFERRELAQAPSLTIETILAKDEYKPDGSLKTRKSFMSLFEKYSLDQFPLRDEFRQVKSLFSYYVMQKKDNNNYYIEGDHIGKIMYPLDETQLKANLKVLNDVYESTIKKKHSNVYVSVIPDKNYYLGTEEGYLTGDYEALFQTVQEQMPWATYIDLTDTLNADSYYYTDHHWRQEQLLPAANKIAEAMGVTIQQEADYVKETFTEDFRGTYYGHAAMPMGGEPIYLMQSDLLKACQVTDRSTGNPSAIYDMSKITADDQYEVYLSGSNSGVMEIINPNGSKRKELVVFRDSFGCSMLPLLLKDYYKVTLVDFRLADYMTINQIVQPKMGKDVLFLYSIEVLTGFLTN